MTTDTSPDPAARPGRTVNGASSRTDDGAAPAGAGTAAGSQDDYAELLPATRRALYHRLALAQRDGRAPSAVAGLVRDGALRWHAGRGEVHGSVPDQHVQYRIGSLTKTFVAVTVLRARDAGLIGLQDRLDSHLASPVAGDATIAQLLSHAGGVAAESRGPWWERTPGSLRPELSDIFDGHPDPRPHPPGRLHHYSNPGYALLGALVAAVYGADSWYDVLRRDVLEPLGMNRTTLLPTAPHADGWAVHPFADVVLPEPAEDTGRMAPAGQLWSTVADLARFAVFLMDGDDRVLSATSLEEMRTPAVPPSDGDWDGGYGLGTQLVRVDDGRILSGHSGSMPGFVLSLWTSPADRLAAVVAANVTSGFGTFGLARRLIGEVAEREPVIPAAWRPMTGADPELLALTGRWFWGAFPNDLRLTPDGMLVLGVLGTGRAARFRADPENGGWVGLDGYFAGERLTVVRRSDGEVSHLDVGSFVFTREPYAEQAPVPGGVAPGGWR